MENQMQLVAKTFQGLEDVLADELRTLGADDVREGTRMVSFKGDKEMLYKANFCCRTALRILKPIHTFTACDADELYEQAKHFNWEQLLSPEKTFAIDSTVYSDEFRHSKFVTYRVKDAIADYFTERMGKRPSIRLTNADILLNVHIYNDKVTLSLDSSGESLHKRGYRIEQTEAPINEVLAAGLIKKTGWHGQCDLIDPMCGSGTFLIEAALIARNVNPGVFRNHYAFENWPDFDRELLDRIYNDDSQECEFEHKIYGSDMSPKAIAVSQRNIKSAGVGKYIDLKVMPIQDYTEAPEGGMLITNPPYGERIGSDDMDALYKAIGEKLKRVFLGYHAWIIGMKTEFFDRIGLKPSVKIPMLNGALECELREFVIFDGKYDEFRKQGGSIRDEEKPRAPRRQAQRRDADRQPRERRWANQGEKFRGERDFRRRNDEMWERDRHGVERKRPKNKLEERYHKPYSERMRDDRRRREESSEEKVRRTVKFRKPQLFDDADFDENPVVMRHRNRKDND